MNDKLEISMNELSHYESLKKQDLEHRKLIKKLQLEIKALKQTKQRFNVLLKRFTKQVTESKTTDSK